jgi:alpha-1,4-galacturonosyltransferase
MMVLGELLSKAKTIKVDDKALIKKLRAMLQTSEDQLQSLKKQSNFLNQLVAKTVPKGLNCLSMQLTVEYNDLSLDQRQFPNKENLEDIRLS